MSTPKPSLANYLASKYLTADTSSSSSSTSKKRKRKNGTTSSSTPTGLIIADDDALGWSNAPIQDEDDPRPTISSSGSAEFRKAKKNAWKTVGVPALQPRDVETEAADRIIAAAAEESTRGMNVDEAPVIEGGDGEIAKMGDGTHAGLQRAEDVAAQFAKRQREEAAEWAAEEKARGKGKKGAVATGEETVYRDATGRRIDISMRRQEARREADEKARKEAEEKEAQRGDVQLAARAKRKEDLDEARFMPVARTIEDVEMNREMKEQDRWNDPAAQFLVRKKEGKSASGKPVYQGAWAPNRYGIRPGHRWDGVDRGNGWEGERFKAMNRRTRNKELDFAWQMDE